jgi:primosomal protein N' (replication factor Y) (superfamily II helicase)
VQAVDVLPAIRSSRFELPLTYETSDLKLRIGDVVRVPMGSRDVLAFVLKAPYLPESRADLKTVRERAEVPRAFDETGLELARFIADRYICTLGEALSAVVRTEALPRMVDRLFRVRAHPHPQRYPSVPKRLVGLIWTEFEDGAPVERILRHPAARKAADRASLLRHIQTLVRSGDLRRERTIVDPRAHEYRMRLLYPGEATIRGSKALALGRFVAERPGVPYADALLAGFSRAVIARALHVGALREELRAMRRIGASKRVAEPVAPTQEQREAIDRIVSQLDSGKHSEILLHGVTASGKTLVYLEVIAHAVRGGGGAIVLVPEISLTPQTSARFEAAFGGRVAVLHSALSDGERLDAWQACARGEIDVVVGARSAVFAPLPRVRLIVVDESHESTYKQDSVPRYHAVAVARERMRIESGLLLLGSATPSVESYAAAVAGRIGLIALRERASRQPLPEVRVVDLSAEFAAGNRRIFSAALTQALSERIDRREKSILFMNRRGSAHFMLCRSCGAVPECPKCSVSLAVHRSEALLRCHYCDHRERIPARCARCKSETISEFGVGTERVVEEVRRLFPRAQVLRMDSDSTTRVGDHARILSSFEESGDVLVGTQMVAKGLDFPQVTLAGVVAADAGLHAPDFRAAERTFDLVMQVCGRSGRASPGLAIVQTYSPNHPAIRFAAQHDYADFATEELEERRALRYPPFARLVYLGVIGRSHARTAQQAARYAELLREAGVAEVLGPAPYPIPRVNEEWRFRISLRTRHAPLLRQAIRERILPAARKDITTRLAVNCDP